jgi:hypothetical protein
MDTKKIKRFIDRKGKVSKPDPRGAYAMGRRRTRI